MGFHPLGRNDGACLAADRAAWDELEPRRLLAGTAGVFVQQLSCASVPVIQPSGGWVGGLVR